MIDLISLLLGLAAGLLIGGGVTWLIVSTRAQTAPTAALQEHTSRTAAAEARVEEARLQLQSARADFNSLRETLSKSEMARVAAETRCEEMLKGLEEEKAILTRARQELADAFKALSGDALKANNEAFLALARSSFEKLQTEAKGDLAQRQQAIDALVKPLQDSLKRYDDQIQLIEKSRQAAYGGLDQHLKTMAESHKQLQQETGNLVKALRAPTVRGRWGEITLKRVAELAGMVAHCDFIEQLSVDTEAGRLRPDMVVQLPGGRQIVVDAKAVLSAYLEAHEAQDETQRSDRLRQHADQIRERLNQLSAKAYWSQFSQSPEFVVLFLPGEHFLSAALERDPTLIEDGFSRSVVIATPSTLMGLLRAAAYGWKQEQLSEHANQVAKLGKDLYERMAMLAEHLENVGEALDKSVKSYNRAIGSISDRLLPTARKFKELGISSDKEIPQLEPIESTPRSAPSMDKERS